MKLLIIGSGGREHALAWKLSQSPRVEKIFIAPGNAGTALVGENVALAADDILGLLAFAQREGIGFSVVGPDDSLAAGIVDAFRPWAEVFGPTASAARLESSKIFAKEFMRRHDIPTAEAREFTDADEARELCLMAKYLLVIKADGLALGKGVVIKETPEEAAEAIHQPWSWPSLASPAAAS